MKRLAAILIGILLVFACVGCESKEPDVIPAPDSDPVQPVKGTIEGYVTDYGAPVSGVTVTIGEKTVTTMRSGKFAIHSVEIADGTLSFSKDGYYSNGLAVYEEDFVDGKALFNVDFARVATASGVVYDNYGNPLSDVVVTGGGSETISNAAGEYVLSAFRRADGSTEAHPTAGLAARDGHLTFTKGNAMVRYGTVQQLVRAERYDSEGNVSGLETVMHRMAQVSGRVVDAGNAPLEGAVVSCGSASATTDGNGEYVIWVYPEVSSTRATYRVYFSMTGYETATTQLSFGANVNGIEYIKTLGTTALKAIPAHSESVLTNSRTDGDRLNVYGRTLFNYDENADLLLNVMSGFEVKFTGTELKVDMKSLPETAINPAYRLPYSTFCVFVDGERNPVENLLSCATVPEGGDPDARTPIYDWHTYTIVEGLEYGEHTVMFVKTDDPLISTCLVKNFRTDGKFLEAPEKPQLKIEVYGDSITSGGDNMLDRDGDGILGEGEGSHDVVPENSNGAATYATYAAFDLGAQIQVFSRSGICLYGANAGDTVDVVSRIYKQVSPKNRTPWNLYNYIPDIVIINLGSNDQFGNMTGFAAAYQQMIRELAGYYGKDTTFVLVHGFADRSESIGAGVTATVSALQSEGYDVHKLSFPAAPYFHPLWSEHREAANELTALLRSLGY